MFKQPFVARCTGIWLVAGVLSACAQPGPSVPSPPLSGAVQHRPPAGTFPLPGASAVMGRVIAIDNITPRWQPSQPTGAGAGVGAVVGGVLGNTVGGGSGRVAATMLGVAGGAVLGNRIEAGLNAPVQAGGSVFRITVQLDQGEQRVLDVPDPGDLRVGDRVQMTPEGFIARV